MNARTSPAARRAPSLRAAAGPRCARACSVTRNPGGAGTLITFDAPRRAVTALAGKQGVTVIKVRSPRMLLQHGFLRTLFKVFDRHRTSVDVVATSEVSVSVTIDDASHLDTLVVDLSHLGDVSVERNRGIVAIVGAFHGHLLALHRAGVFGDDLINHPVALAFVSKLVSLCRMTDGPLQQGQSSVFAGALRGRLLPFG